LPDPTTKPVPSVKIVASSKENGPLGTRHPSIRCRDNRCLRDHLQSTTKKHQLFGSACRHSVPLDCVCYFKMITAEVRVVHCRRSGQRRIFYDSISLNELASCTACRTSGSRSGWRLS
jgi:hypothetical protein